MRINFEGRLLHDPRFADAAIELGVHVHQVQGAILHVAADMLANRSASMPERRIDALAQIRGYAAALVAADLATRTGDTVTLEPDLIDHQLAWLREQDRKSGLGVAARFQPKARPVGQPAGDPAVNPLKLGLGSEAGTEVEVGVEAEGNAPVGAHPGKRSRKGRSRSTKVPEGYKETSDYFFDRFKIANGGVTPTWGATQGRQLKQLLGQHPAAEVQRRIGILFDGKGPTWIKPAWTWSTVYSRFDDLVQPSAGGTAGAGAIGAAPAQINHKVSDTLEGL